MSEHILHVASAPWTLAIAGLLWLLAETIASRYVRPRGEDSQ